MTRAAFPVTDVDKLDGARAAAAARRDAADSDGATAGVRDEVASDGFDTWRAPLRLAPTRIGLTLPTATRAGCEAALRELIDDADSYKS